MSSQKARELVTWARERQRARLRETGVSVNAHMDVGMLTRYVRLDEKGEQMLRRARESGMLSSRGQHRVLRVARTVADLHGRERIRASDVGTAISLRPDASLAGSRAA